MLSLGFRVKGLGFKGFGVKGLGLRVSGFRVLGFGVLGFRVLGPRGLGFRERLSAVRTYSPTTHSSFPLSTILIPYHPSVDPWVSG